MKRIVLTLLAMLILYAAYTDLTTGSLQQAPAFATKPDQASNPLVQTVTVQSGDTVLSITEKLHKGKVPVPIHTLIADFKNHNEQTEPTAIQVGKRYQFPLYSMKTKQEATP